MLRQATRTQKRSLKILLQPLSARTEPYFEQRRGLQLFDIFSKEKAKERQERLKEETSRGYFDDFKELRDSKGKLFEASTSILPTAQSAAAPQTQLLRPDGSETSLFDEAKTKDLTLLCLAFRSGAEGLLASWSMPFGDAHNDSNCQHIELSLVDSVVMAWWPFKDMILRGTSRQAEASQLKPVYLFSFGDAHEFFEALSLSNRLTGYVFLLDFKGRIRWRASGAANDNEREAFLSCCQQILAERRVKADGIERSD